MENAVKDIATHGDRVFGGLEHMVCVALVRKGLPEALRCLHRLRTESVGCLVALTRRTDGNPAARAAFALGSELLLLDGEEAFVDVLEGRLEVLPLEPEPLDTPGYLLFAEHFKRKLHRPIDATASYRHFTSPQTGRWWCSR